MQISYEMVSNAHVRRLTVPHKCCNLERKGVALHPLPLLTPITAVVDRFDCTGMNSIKVHLSYA